MNDRLDLIVLGYVALLSFFLGTALAKLLYSYDIDRANRTIAKLAIENGLMQSIIIARGETDARNSAD